jgi:pimeloyl-ACP methyl ester carboxylesterase/quercetin dioxygenase-like cupin family protein
MTIRPPTTIVAVTFGLMLAAGGVTAQPSIPSTFKTQTVTTPSGAEIFVRSGGSGPAAVLIHGYADTGDMWGPLAVELARTHTVIVPDLRGMGRSSKPAAGYDKHTQAGDIRAVITALGLDRAAVVAHDIGNMVAYAYAARYRDKVDRLVVMDAPIPGIDPWDELLRNPLLWHFSFGGPDAERLVQGRERIFLDRFWNEFAADPSKIDEGTRAHYAALYAQPGAMRAGFAQFAAFSKDAEDNKISQRMKLTMPVLAVGGEKSFGKVMGVIMRNVASDVQDAIVPGAGHWLMEENAPVTVTLVRDFLNNQQAGAGERRTSPKEFEFSGLGPGTGSSGVSGIRTVVLKGDPDQAGLYTIMLFVPAKTRIAAHDHPDDRVATVVSGTWYFGYGDRFETAALKALPAGSYYTEPPNRRHFAETRDEPVIVQITGFGPSATAYVDPNSDPRRPPR